MPIIQKPTLYLVNAVNNQYSVRSVIQSFTGDQNQKNISLPGVEPFSGSVYNLDFSGILTPARGNVPDIRCLLFSIQCQLLSSPPPALLSNIYLFNPQTGQLIMLTPAPMTSSGVVVFPDSGTINGCVPFFMSAVQSLVVILENQNNPGMTYTFNISALTFDSSSFLTAVGVAA